MAKKPSPIPFWGTATSDGFERAYIRIGSSLLHHEAMMKLPSNAFRLYVYMTLECRGYQDFTMPHSRYKKFMSKPTFIKARDDLVQAGFIEITEKNGNLRKPNKYRFSKRYREE